MELRVKSERQRDTAGSYRATRAEGLIEAYREMLRILDPLARREAGEERCEGCGAWAPLEVMHSDGEGVWLCGGCNSIQESAQHLKVTP
jgi:hypothetical protein